MSNRGFKIRRFTFCLPWESCSLWERHELQCWIVLMERGGLLKSSRELPQYIQIQLLLSCPSIPTLVWIPRKHDYNSTGWVMEFEDNIPLGVLKYFFTPNLYINLKTDWRETRWSWCIQTQKAFSGPTRKKIRDFIYPPFTVRPGIVFFANTPNSSVFPVAGFCKAIVMRNVRSHSVILICKARGLSSL